MNKFSLRFVHVERQEAIRQISVVSAFIRLMTGYFFPLNELICTIFFSRNIAELRIRVNLPVQTWFANFLFDDSTTPLPVV